MASDDASPKHSYDPARSHIPARWSLARPRWQRTTPWCCRRAPPRCACRAHSGKPRPRLHRDAAQL